MNILSIFVLIPLLMLLGLWLSRNIKQIRTVMVVGASALVLAAVGLTIAYLQARAAGDTGQEPGGLLQGLQEHDHPGYRSRPES